MRTLFAAGTAADDVRGSWALQYDKFKEVVVCRNLLFLGYSFYYNCSTNTWGSFYNGDGLKNTDLIFML
jgi:radial spoke head protein 9